MGVVYRAFKIVIGLAFLAVLFIFGVVVVVSWYLLPIFAARYLGVWSILFFGFVFAGWRVSTRNLPGILVVDANEKNYLKSFRPTTLHYLDSTDRLFSHKDILVLLRRLELDMEEFKLVPVRNDIAKKAFEFAKKHGTRYVEPEHLFLALVACSADYERMLAKFKLTLDICDKGVAWIVLRREYLSKIFFWQEGYDVPSIGGVNRALTGRITPALDAVSTDLTDQVYRGRSQRITGHRKEAQEIIQILESSPGANVLIIGPPGSGKSSIVRRIAQKIIKGDAGSEIKFKRVVSVDAGSLISGAKTPGDVAEKVRSAMKDAQDSGNIILFFDEIHNLVLGDSGDSAIFSILQTYFASDKFQIIGATNIENYRKYIEPNGAFARLFKVVEIGETDEAETTEILENVSYDLEQQYGVMISYPAIVNTYTLAKKLIHERVFPDKGIDVLARTSIREKEKDRYVTESDVAETVSDVTNVPVTAIRGDESKKLLDMEVELKKRVIGQDHAVELVAKAMKRGRVGLRNEGKPIDGFLFVGTTGVGKTETARVLAEYYFGSAKSMVRLDMSEYQQAESMTRLIGSPDGSTKGLLTEAVRKSPFALVLLDEIEKAHPQVMTAFLQVFDDGRLTEPLGRVVDFTNTIIIATSNVGTRSIQEISEKGGSFDEIQSAAMKAVQDHFAPELLNRFSGIIVYRPLDEKAVFEITKIMLERVRKNVAEKGIKVSFKPELVNELIKRGYDKENGARPLARVIEDSVETYLAIKILSSELKSGDEVELGVEVFENK